MQALRELRTFLHGLRADFRRRRNFVAVIDTEAADQIAADAQREQATASRAAYSAEQSDREAARLLAAAQSPESDGGRAITPREAAPISRLILRSAEADHDIAEQLAT